MPNNESQIFITFGIRYSAFAIGYSCITKIGTLL